MSIHVMLKEMSELFGVSGFESEVRSYIIKRLNGLVDEYHVDALGSVIAIKKGKTNRTLLLDAHLDEIGFIVTYIDDRGFIRINTLGGWEDIIPPGQRVTIKTRSGNKIAGVIGHAPPHIVDPDAKGKAIPISNLVIDVGSSNKEEVQKAGIYLGDPIIIHSHYTEMLPPYVSGKAFDDRVGCVNILATLERLKSVAHEWNIAASFSFGEEIGLRGAQAVGYSVAPDVALMLEGTVAADVPGIAPDKVPTRTGNGPAISVIDRSILVPQRMVQFLESIAQEYKIPYQLKTIITGGTNAGMVHQTRSGVLCGVISVPCRYIHSPVTVLNKNDFEHAVELTYHAVMNIAKLPLLP